jgi:hypothetical protein
MSEYLEYLKEANLNFYTGIEGIYAAASPKERVRLEDNRIALEQAITIIEQFIKEPQKDAITKSTIEKEYLEIFNRVKKLYCERARKKFTPTKVISKPSQLHARIREGHTMDDLGKVIYLVFSDPFHAEKGFKYATTEYCTRSQTLEKYL